jgi:hypothetical protein
MTMFRNSILTTALALVLASPAGAETYTLRDLSVEPTAPQTSPFRTGALTAEAWFDRSNAIYALGEAVRCFVRTNEDGYVTALSIGPTGAVTQIFPNAFHPNNAVRAYAPIEIPGWGARAVVTGSLGPEVVKIIVTSQPIQVIPASQLGAAGPFRSVIGGIGAVARDLETLADPTYPDQNIMIVDKTFRSVAPAGAAFDSGAIVIVPDEAPAPAAPNFYPLPAIAPSPSASLDVKSAFTAAVDRDMVSREQGSA